jgi:hypothetical protein
MLDIKRIDMTAERDEIIDKIKSIVSTRGYGVEAMLEKDHYRLRSNMPTRPDEYFWFDDYNQICCKQGGARSLRLLGLNPIAEAEYPASSALDIQVAGSHYKDMVIQPWELMRAVMTREEYTAYHIGTVMAYLMRHKAKGGEQDIKKAQHHLTELVEYLNAA